MGTYSKAISFLMFLTITLFPLNCLQASEVIERAGQILQEREIPPETEKLKVDEEGLSGGYEVVQEGTFKESKGPPWSTTKEFREQMTRYIKEHASPAAQIAGSSFVARQALKAYTVTNTTTAAEVKSYLMGWNVPANTARKNAPKLLKIARSVRGKGALIAISGGAAAWAVVETWTVVETVHSEWSIAKKVSVVAVVMLVVVLGYVGFRTLKMQA